jgi:hypothetical protein
LGELVLTEYLISLVHGKRVAGPVPYSSSIVDQTAVESQSCTCDWGRTCQGGSPNGRKKLLAVAG